MVCRGPERLYCRSREAPAGRDAPARRTAEAAHANRVPRPPRLRRRRRGSGPPVLSTPAASTIPRGRTLSARPRLHRRVRLLPAPLPYTPLTIPIEIPSLPVRALPLIARARAMASGGVHTVRDLARVSVGDGSRWPAVVTPSSAEANMRGKETEERSTRQKTVRVCIRYLSQHSDLASITWVLALLTFAPAISS